MGNLTRSAAYATVFATAILAVACRGSPRPADGPPAPSTVASPRPMDFRFAPGDQIEMSVWKGEEVKDLKTVQRILPDGTFTPPRLAPMPLAGLTVKEARETLVALYTQYVVEPEVWLRVVDVYALRIFVLGEVKSPVALAVLGPTSVFHAITAAGGFNEGIADKCTVRIVRPKAPGVPPDVYSVNTIAILGGERPDVMLMPGDVVYVHPTGLADWSRNLTQALAPAGTILGSVGSVASTIVAIKALN